MTPCDKSEEIKKISNKLDTVITMLHKDRISVVKIEKDVSLHKKMWGGILTFILGIVLFIIKKEI